ncbi:MAG: stalk domain-containing protein [Bacillota bacterium]
MLPVASVQWGWCGRLARLAACVLVLVGFLVRPVAADIGTSVPGENMAVFLVGGMRYRVGSDLREMDAAPFVDSGRTFVPVRYLAYALGVPEEGVRWDGVSRTVTLSTRGTEVKLIVGSPVLLVDGREVRMDVLPRLAPPGRVVLPARFVAEAFEYEVGWDAAARAVLIGPPGRLPEAPEAPAVLEARVLRAVDGDTLEVEFGRKREKVRLIGVDCPGLAHPDLGIREEEYGREAASYTARRLEGRAVWLEQDVSERDRYGRLLAYVWLDRPWGRTEAEVRRWMFNAELLLEGYAHVMTVPPDVRYADLFVWLAREAREAGRGLWGAGGEGQAASIVIASVDLKGEVVVVENRGREAVDLGGWKLVSEVGNQVFAFPAGAVLPAGGVLKVVSGPNARSGSGVLVWTKAYVWNNDGDPAALYDAAGELVSRWP